MYVSLKHLLCRAPLHILNVDFLTQFSFAYSTIDPFTGEKADIFKVNTLAQGQMRDGQVKVHAESV